MGCGYSRQSGFTSIAAQRDQRDFPALCAWIDDQYDGSPNHLWSSWSSMVATAAIILAVGSAILDDKLVNFPGGIVWGTYGASVAVSALVLHFVTFRRRLKDSRAHGRRFVQSRQSLIEAREKGELKNLFGIEGAMTMNKAAESLLRIQSAFDTEAWRSSQGGIYSTVRDNSIGSAEAAMSRLILLTNVQGSSSQRTSILEDLESLANEAEQVTNLGGRDRSAESGLREALSELRDIRRATEEAQESLPVRE